MWIFPYVGAKFEAALSGCGELIDLNAVEQIAGCLFANSL
jgi:hypothetical protein